MTSPLSKHWTDVCQHSISKHIKHKEFTSTKTFSHYIVGSVFETIVKLKLKAKK